LQQRKLHKLKYTLEEKRSDNKEPTRFQGFEDVEYQQAKDGTANYALMMFDEEMQCFKIVPVEKHFKFQKIIEHKKKKAEEEPLAHEMIEGVKVRKVTKISELRSTIKDRFKQLN